LAFAGMIATLGGRFVKSFVCGLLAVGMAALLVASLSAEDTKKAKGKKPAGAKDPFAGIFPFKQVKLDDKQTEQVETLKKEYGPKLAELTKKYTAVITPQRAKDAHEASKKALADGKSKGEAKKAAQEALKLTTDEQATLKEIGKDRKKLGQEIRQKITALLTDEQKEALKAKPKPKKEKPKETTKEKPKEKAK
jgi:Spy/CpxP family protein refolding chaperone